MPYDPDLAARIRDLLDDEPELTERKMFGGLGFMLGGHMAVAASSRGGLLVRVDPMEADRLVATTAAEPMEMGGRNMGGWLHVDGDHLRTARQLRPWVRRGVASARSLPPKRPARRSAGSR